MQHNHDWTLPDDPDVSEFIQLVAQASDLWASLIGFITFYSFLLVIELYLMFKFARLGPSSLHTGRYHHEQNQGGDPALTMQPAAPVKD